MKAALCINYGNSNNVIIGEIEKPKIKSNQVLVKIKASALNSGDVRVRALNTNWFLKIMMRLIIGIKKPRNPVLGTVYSGIIEEIGNNVTQFKIGDEVLGITGFNFSCHAEYIAVNEDSNIIKKPFNASFNEAAAIAFGGQTAYYFLEKSGIKKIDNAEILIYGASGSVGSSAVQIAKFYNAKVTAIASKKNESFLRELDIDEFIDYESDQFKKLEKKYDIILDAVGKINKNKLKNNLKKEGKFLTVGGLDYAKENIQQLFFLKELFESGKLKACIDKTFELNQITEAHKYVETERKKGNVVIEI